MKDYISFQTTSSFNTNKKISFSNEIGKNPFILNNKLYIPKEMLRDEYQENFVFEMEPKKQTVQTNNEIISKKPTGLINYGSSVCYMNALLQCFYYCYPMTQYFLTIDEYKKSKLGLVSKAYYDFVQGLYLGNEYAAKNFKDALISTDPSFAGKEGKDSKDLALFILSELSEELKENENSIMVLNKNVNKYNKLEVYKEKINLINYNNNNTIISDTFDYLLLIEHRCKNYNCKNIYSKSFYNIQDQNIIIFELETIYKKMDKYANQILLDECIFYYFEDEIINCAFCNTKRLEIKKSICSLPKIFIFVMSRGKNAQFDCKIKFTQEIDMKNYYTPIDEKQRAKNTKYNLICATLVYDWYRGYAHGGHTIAFCKTSRNGQYYIFNDSRAYPYNINKIYDETPYILFYERKGN